MGEKRNPGRIHEACSFQELFDTIANELNRQLYIKPSEDLFFELGRLASMRRNGVILASEDISSRLNLPGATKKYSGVFVKGSDEEAPVLREDGCVLEETGDPSKREAKPVQHIAVLIEAAAFLRRLPDLVDVLKRRMASGMASIVHHTTVYAREYLAGPEHSLTDSKLLAELLQLLFRQFKIVAMLHRLIVSQLKRVREARRMESSAGLELSYTMNDVWEVIQGTLQQVLNDYLDIKNAAMNIGGGGIAHSSVLSNNQLLAADNSLSTYFNKKKPTRGKKATLFRFDSTMHAIKVASYVREQKLYALPSLTTMAEDGTGDQTLLICGPTPENAIIIFKPLMKFVSEIEESDGASSVNLRAFMENYIRDYYLPKMQGELMQKLEIIFQSGDAHDALWTSEEAKRLDANVPLLICAVRVSEICRNLEVLMQSAPVFAPKFAELWLQVLNEFRKFAQLVFEKIGRSIKQEGNVEVERRKISAAWAVDEDISRLLKSLPNWLALTENASVAASTPFSPPVANMSILATPMMESAEDIRQRNMRESEILISNLGMQKRIDEHEVILDDIYNWKLLANMHESMQWFCRTMRMYLQHLPANVINILKEAKQVQTTSVSAALGVAGVASVLDATFLGFDTPSLDATLYRLFETSLAALDEAAATFLLMLHLEVRVHCFYFLLPIAKQTVARSHGEEIDEQVVRLNKDLMQLHDSLSSNLQNRKVKYVFEGLGHLVAAIFINSAHHILKINDSGKKRMCKDIFSVQQCLSTITGTRESDLDSARRYFELLYKTPDDILNTIVEKGPEFTELEYQHLLGLSIRSHPIYSSEPGSLDLRVNRLREIMNERSKK